MKMIKNNSLIAILLVGMVGNVRCMDKDGDVNRSLYLQHLGLPLDLGREILGKSIELKFNDIVAMGKLQQTNFEAAQEIGEFLLRDAEARKIVENPTFCLKLIKALTQHFNSTNESVAKELKITAKIVEAEKLLQLQNKLTELCKKPAVSMQELKDVYAQGVDLEFTQIDDGLSLPLAMTPLGLALINLNETAVKFLIEHGANVNNHDNPGKNTPLWIASSKYNRLLSLDEKEKMKNLITMLLGAGADPKIVDKYGSTPSSLVQDKKLIQLLESNIK